MVAKRKRVPQRVYDQLQAQIIQIENYGKRFDSQAKDLLHIERAAENFREDRDRWRTLAMAHKQALDIIEAVMVPKTSYGSPYRPPGRSGSVVDGVQEKGS